MAIKDLEKTLIVHDDTVKGDIGKNKLLAQINQMMIGINNRLDRIRAITAEYGKANVTTSLGQENAQELLALYNDLKAIVEIYSNLKTKEF